MNALSPPPKIETLATEQILLNRVALLERRLQALSRRVAASEGLDADDSDLPDALEIDAESQVELASGFYAREWDGEGNAFRWAGREEQFEFRFFLDRGASRQFVLRGILAEGIGSDAIQALVDYRPVPVRAIANRTMLLIEGRIPADRFASGATLTFVCPTVKSPVAEDARRLSFAFCGLRIGEAAAPMSTPSSTSLRAPPVPEASPERRRHA